MLMKSGLIIAVVFSAILTGSLRADVTLAQSRKAVAEIDRILAEHWKNEKVTRNAPIRDEIFVRRLYLDLAGRIPTPAEAAAFIESREPEKRDNLIEHLLKQESYVSHYFNFWADIMRYKSYFNNTANAIPAAYGLFLKESLRSNKPYDQLVRELLSAKGWAWENGAIGYYHRDPEMPLDNMAITSRIFLGTRIECAQCHNHPFDKWKQTEFYHLAAYTYPNRSINEAFNGARDAQKARESVILEEFKREKAASQDGGKAAEKRKEERMAALHYRKIVGIIKSPVGQLLSPVALDRYPNHVLKLPHDFKEEDGKPFDVMAPATPFGEAAPVAQGQDSVAAFASWVASPKNPRFTKVIVNRLWKKLFGLPVNTAFDELRDDTKAMIPELEVALERLMIELGYDMRAFLAVIARTQAYQSATSAEAYTLGTTYHFTGPILRRMTAEQIWDSFVTLASYEPDARDLEREFQQGRRIGISQMVADAYLNFDGTKLIDMAYANLKNELDFDQRTNVVREGLIVANRSQQSSRVIELRHKEGDLDRERGEAFVRNFINPLLDNLARLKNQPVVEDPLYKMNANPRVLTTETWRKRYIPGYGPAPKSAAQLESEARDREQSIDALIKLRGIEPANAKDFTAYVRKSAQDWKRASELESPAPRGHFLRTMGQSDREYVENANPSAAIPQALLLMNNDVVTGSVLLSRWSPLMQFVQKAETPEKQIDAAYLALLSRKATPEEKASWQAAQGKGLNRIEDLVFALLNTRQFLFIQ